MNISVIIPVYNGAKFLKPALDSVFAQTVPAKEIIIIDDGSTDDSANIIRSYDSKIIKYLYQDNAGICKSRNLGIKLAQSEYISFLDQDDLYLPTKFEASLIAFQQNHDIDIVQGKWRYLFCENSLELDNNQNRYNVLLGSHLFKKSCFDKIGLFDETIKFSEDVDIFMRVKNFGLKVHQIDHLCLLYRSHENNTTKSLEFQRENQKCMLKVLQKSIKMRQEQNGK